MRAILRTGFGRPDVLVIREIPEPEPKDGHAVIEVKAFGLNHAELHMRKGEWAEIAGQAGGSQRRPLRGERPPRGDDRAFDGPLQLPDVARPRVAEELAPAGQADQDLATLWYL
jgi:hypothetical protein